MEDFFNKCIKRIRDFSNHLAEDSYGVSEKIHDTFLRISRRNVINVIVEIFILCFSYSVGYALHVDLISGRQLVMENILLIFLYFAAYYFLPKKEFDFKTFLLFIFSFTMLIPAMIMMHSLSEVFNIYEFVFLSSCIFGLVFRLDFENYKKISVVVIFDGAINNEKLSSVESEYKVIYVVCSRTYSEKYLSFENLDGARRFMTFIRILSIFSFPTKVIYFSGTDPQRINSVRSFAQEFGLGIEQNPQDTASITSEN